MLNSLDMNLAMADILIELNTTNNISLEAIRKYRDASVGINQILIYTNILDTVVEYFKSEVLTMDYAQVRGSIEDIINKLQNEISDMNKFFMLNYIMYLLYDEANNNPTYKLDRLIKCDNGLPINNPIYEINYKNHKLLLMLVSKSKEIADIMELTSELRVLIPQRDAILSN